MSTETTTTPTSSQKPAFRQFAVGAEVAVFNEYNEVFVGRVTAVRVERNGYPTTTVDIPAPFRTGKGYRGVYAVERLYTPAEAEALIVERTATFKLFGLH